MVELGINMRAFAQVRRLRTLFALSSYKPGHFVEVTDDGPPAGTYGVHTINVLLRASVDDSEHPGKTEVFSRSVHPVLFFESMSDEKCVRWLKSRWREVEFHELDEHFRFEGKVVDEPHPERLRFFDRTAFASPPKEITGLDVLINYTTLDGTREYSPVARFKERGLRGMDA